MLLALAMARPGRPAAYNVCIQLWSLHEQCHQLRGWGVVCLLYLLACALQYRTLITMQLVAL
jgi:hypothetical protein